jgi:hypothetical protein
MRILALTLLTACGSVPNEAKDFYHSLDQIDCEFKARCCNDTRGQDVCTQTLDNRRLNTLGQIQTEVDQGILVYHSDIASNCLNAQKGARADCMNDGSALHANDDLCAGVFTGMLASGGACYTGGGCAAGLACFRNTACTAPTPQGGDCTTTACAAGLVCLPGFKCGAPLAAGASCTISDQCQSHACNQTCLATVTVSDLDCSLN